MKKTNLLLLAILLCTALVAQNRPAPATHAIRLPAAHLPFLRLIRELETQTSLKVSAALRQPAATLQVRLPAATLTLAELLTVLQNKYSIHHKIRYGYLFLTQKPPPALAPRPAPKLPRQQPPRHSRTPEEADTPVYRRFTPAAIERRSPVGQTDQPPVTAGQRFAPAAPLPVIAARDSGGRVLVRNNLASEKSNAGRGRKPRLASDLTLAVLLSATDAYLPETGLEAQYRFLFAEWSCDWQPQRRISLGAGAEWAWGKSWLARAGYRYGFLNQALKVDTFENGLKLKAGYHSIELGLGRHMGGWKLFAGPVLSFRTVHRSFVSETVRFVYTRQAPGKPAPPRHVMAPPALLFTRATADAGKESMGWIGFRVKIVKSIF